MFISTFASKPVVAGKRILCALALVGAASVAQAADYVFDTAHTQVLFKVSHMGFSNSTGAFVGVEGGFSFDEANPEQSSVNVTIPVAGLDMDHDVWKEHLSSDKWFNLAKYPTMTFKSTKVVKTGENSFDVMGDLTLLGTTKPVTLKTVLNKVGMQMGKAKAGFSAVTTIDRTEFGMSTYAPMIGTNVDISIEVEGERQ